MTTLNQTEPLPSGITQSTSEAEPMMNDRLVITENAASPEAGVNDKPAQEPSATNSLPTTDVVIPESVRSDEGTHPVKEQVHEVESSQPLLPSIGVFLSKTCTIPLIHCDFEQIEQTVELRTTIPSLSSLEWMSWHPRIRITLHVLPRLVHILKHMRL